MAFEDRSGACGGINVDEVQVACLVSLVGCDVDVACDALRRSGGLFEVAVAYIFSGSSSSTLVAIAPIRVDDDDSGVPSGSYRGSDDGIPCGQRSRTRSRTPPGGASSVTVFAASPRSVEGGTHGASRSGSERSRRSGSMGSSGSCSTTQPYPSVVCVPLPPVPRTPPRCDHCSNLRVVCCESCATSICTWHSHMCIGCTQDLCEACFEAHRCVDHDPVQTATQVYVGDGVFPPGSGDLSDGD